MERSVLPRMKETVGGGRDVSVCGERTDESAGAGASRRRPTDPFVSTGGGQAGTSAADPSSLPRHRPLSLSQSVTLSADCVSSGEVIST